MKYLTIVTLTLWTALFAGCATPLLRDCSRLYMSQKMIHRVAGQWDKGRFHLYSFKPYTTLDTSSQSLYGWVGVSLSLNESDITVTEEQARQWIFTLYSQVHNEVYQPFQAKGDLDPSRRIKVSIHFSTYIEPGEFGIVYVTVRQNRVFYYGTTPDNPTIHIILEERVPEHLIVP